MLRLVLAALCLGAVVAQDDVFGVFTFKCSTATVCVDKPTCDQFGVLAKNVVALTEEEEANRAPLVPCKKPDGGRGVCCRDPDFVDDWPTDINYDLKGQYRPAPPAGYGCPSRNRVSY